MLKGLALAAIAAFKAIESRLSQLPKPFMKAPLARIVELNVQRGLMNAYRFQAIKTPVTAEHAQLLLASARQCAKSVMDALPKEAITLKGWLLQAPEVDAEAFLGILYNDLGKFLKDTNDESQSTAWQCDRLRTAISLLEHAIKYAPKEDPSAVFAREALVDAKIKSRVLVQQAFSKAAATNNRTVEAVSAESMGWPVLFNAGQKRELAELLDFVIRQTEAHGNTGWQAYLDGVERMSVLRSYGVAKTDQPQAK